MPAATSLSEIAAAAPHQRARGAGRIAFAADDTGRTRLCHLHQEGALKLRFPRKGAAAGTAEAIVINTAGGLTGGDRLALGVDVGPGATAVITSQAAERVYRSLGGPAEIAIRLAVGAGGRLDWLPQETILFDRGRLARRVDADLEDGATLTLVEAVILGRTAMGEAVAAGAIRDRWRVRLGGRLIHADDLRLDGDVAALQAWPATLAGGAAFASILQVGAGAERRLDAVREALGESGGASAFDGKLVARVVATDGHALRGRLVPALTALTGSELPRVWRM